jgi:hypothetical protein
LEELPEDFTETRITTKSLFADFLAVMNLERGVFYTIKGLIMKPSSTNQDYFFGDRRRHAHPLRMLVFTSAIAALLTITLVERTDGGMNFSINEVPVEMDQYFADLTPEEQSKKMAEQQLATTFMAFVKKNLNFVYLLMVPIAALFSALFFMKKGFNFAEHLVVNAFMAGINNFIYIIFFIAVWFWAPAFAIYTVVVILFNFYFYMTVYKSKSLAGFFKSLGTLFFTYAVAMAGMAGAIIWVVISRAEELGIPID